MWFLFCFGLLVFFCFALFCFVYAFVGLLAYLILFAFVRERSRDEEGCRVPRVNSIRVHVVKSPKIQ